MNDSDLIKRAAAFQELNRAGGLLLPNAWDAASARVFETTGFPAIGTTSSGIANARGLGDAELIGRDGSVREIASITAAVSVPVTADIESGYGPSPADVATTVAAVLDAGAVGVNLEDNTHGTGEQPLFRIDEQTARIAAARATAADRGVPLVINARTDTFILQLGDTVDERLAMTGERGRAYLEAGADLVFIPLVVDLDLVRRLATAIGGPISLMAMPGAPAASELFAAGASRVSLGQTAMLATMGALRAIAEDIRDTGTWTTIERGFYGFGEADALFAGR
ncbi:MAG: isocitrate lyase/phosphoenolpyruvate mutase family protein [Chloroflexota bacterium]|nr:isocitrate lyase/phosphoenolpyruvate mutase family protein [Chloroflexota bacterium]